MSLPCGVWIAHALVGEEYGFEYPSRGGDVRLVWHMGREVLVRLDSLTWYLFCKDLIEGCNEFTLSDICNLGDFISLHDYSFPNYSEHAIRSLPSRRRKSEPEKTV